MEDSSEHNYIGVYSHLMRSIGIYLAERVVRLVSHFFLAPQLQIVGYIMKFLGSEGLDTTHIGTVIELVRLRNCLSYRIDYSLASEINQKNNLVPSYCLTCRDNHCRVCKNSLSFWKSRCKRYSKKTVVMI